MIWIWDQRTVKKRFEKSSEVHDKVLSRMNLFVSKMVNERRTKLEYELTQILVCGVVKLK